MKRGAELWYNSVMKEIATNIADFETLRKNGMVYVDKTAYLHKLILSSFVRGRGGSASRLA